MVREVERLPDVPPDDQQLPEAVLALVGELAAFDHWRQRVTLVVNAYVEPGSDDVELDRAYDRAVERLDQLATDGASPRAEPLVEPPDPDDPLPEVTSTVGSSAYELAVEAAREHILAGDIFQVVLSQRFDFELDGRSLRRLPGASPGEPEPVHVPGAHAARDPWWAPRPSPWSSCSTAG